MTRLYAETPDSNHMGVGGMLKPTEKQVMIERQLDMANERVKELIKKLD